MTPPARAAVAARSSMPAAPARRHTPVRNPRRVSGPARPAPRGAHTAAPAVALPRAPIGRRGSREAPGLALRAIDAVNGISQSTLLDRLIRSRVWIGLIASSLIGLVAMQLLVLHFNTQVGRALTREAALQRQNTQLSIAASQDSAGSLVEPAAAAAGMTVAPPGSLHFLQASPSDVGAAVAALRAPLAQEAPAGEASTPATSASEMSSSVGGSTGEASSATGPAGEPSSSTASTSEAPAAGATTGASSSSPAVASSTGAATPETGASGARAEGG